jgi:hypothetical protein
VARTKRAKTNPIEECKTYAGKGQLSGKRKNKTPQPRESVKTGSQIIADIQHTFSSGSTGW